MSAAALTLPGLGKRAIAAPRGLTPLQAARQQATPEAELRPSLHSYPLTEEKKTLKIMVPHYQIDWANNAFTKWYEDRTNVHVEWTVVEDEAAITQLNLQLASGDYPDIIMGFNWSPFELTPTVISAYGGEGVFVALNDYLDEYAPNLNQYVIPEYPIATKIMTMADGQIYSLPYINDCYHCQYSSQKLWVQTQWLDALGLEAPTTIEEFEAMLQAFKTGDPNGNGQADEVPLTAFPDWPLEGYMMSPFQITPKKPWLYNDGGKVTASYMQEGWAQGAAYLQGLTSKGLLSPEIFTQNIDQIRALGNNNQIGAAPGVVQGTFMTTTEGTPGLWSDFHIMAPVAGPSGKRQVFRDFDESHLGNVFVITDKCPDPALAVAWADGLYAWDATIRSIFGVPDVDWRAAEDGELGVDGEPARYAKIPQPANNSGEDQHQDWAQLSPSFRNAKDRLSEAAIGDREANTEVLLYEGCHDQLEPYATGEDVDLLRPIFTAEEATRVSDLETVIVDFVREQLALQVTGQADPNDRDPFLEQLKSLGIDEYLELQQTAYDRVNG